MVLENCPECKKEVSSKANTCPHCGFKTKNNNGKILIGIIILVLATFIMNNYINKKNDDLTKPTATEYDALIYAQNKVKEQLKSPSTAKFPSYTERKGHSSGYGEEFEVNSWVDSQNSFGAIIRTYYSCKVLYDGDYVRIVDLKIN